MAWSTFPEMAYQREPYWLGGASSVRLTFLTTTLTTAEHLCTPSYTTPGLPSSLITPSARAYGSQARFHPLRIRHAVRIACSEPPR